MEGYATEYLENLKYRDAPKIDIIIVLHDFFFPMRSEVEVPNLTMDLVVMLVVLALVLSSPNSI